MTSEQIEKLNGTDWAPVHVWRRLLDERNRLLEAVKDAAAEIDAQPVGDSRLAHMAIAFAEADPLF